MGPLCVTSRNVVFEITNWEPGTEYEWIFDNGTTSYSLFGETIGTYFDEFGPTWAANPNSDVNLTIRAKNACGYAVNNTFLISAARFKSPNDQDCAAYLRKRTSIKTPNSKLICYPNPSTKLITVLKPDNINQGELIIYNNIGEVISKQTIDSDSNINTENWQLGIYYISLYGTNKTFSTKIEIRK